MVTPISQKRDLRLRAGKTVPKVLGGKKWTEDLNTVLGREILSWSAKDPPLPWHAGGRSSLPAGVAGPPVA